MARINIDGSAFSGGYRVSCDGCTAWHGAGESVGDRRWSPALPIAEAVVHHRQEHATAPLDIAFSFRFEAWLRQYWGDASLRQARALAPPS